ncbi:LCP family protein [Nocardioides dongkuii]|uniref:LCP family protein n=1 Tax=Nocardioides dongkuii TaxID=2760089 RepID=UPI001878E590|nr:LCP family protein [Nocardioides dongkuii]
MADVEPPVPEQPSDARGRRTAKRRGRARKRHTVAKVLLATVLSLAMVTGLGTIWLYRDLNSNLTVLDVVGQLDNRPDKPSDDEPGEPLNILVMGSDDRDGAGNNIDGLTGDGERSDTTILFHLSGDREFAYGVSIPRDSLVTRPECEAEDGSTIPGAANAMWNEAFALGGPACTIQQFEQLTDVRIDHYVVVDFAGFQTMVDAIDGVPVCIPEDIEDPAHGIRIPAGSREIEGKEALNYVRARYTLGDGSDIGRVKRQQAFIAAMANKVVSGGVLARPDRLVGFLQAATEALTVDPGLSNVLQLSKVGLGFNGIGLNQIRFITVPWAYDQREEFRGRVVWTPAAETVWQRVRDDEVISRRLDSTAINAGNVPGSPGSGSDDGSDGGSDGPSGGSSDGPDSGSGGTDDARSEEDKAALEAAGLCT